MLNLGFLEPVCSDRSEVTCGLEFEKTKDPFAIALLSKGPASGLVNQGDCGTGNRGACAVGQSPLNTSGRLLRVAGERREQPEKSADLENGEPHASEGPCRLRIARFWFFRVSQGVQRHDPQNASLRLREICSTFTLQSCHGSPPSQGQICES